eukprot:CAMPEP_0198198128 /NCGR_PEP_ID=MMETSP1445-20131203/1615_1 /TAXON_ID=36898 /ORGANISM="Pyramimonas sp., Strain CCMP2087" /LENGTH=240 /DNA_ID=CAMNT_0043867593 /DNA_START=192 /DNA_END=910 /DNA_ORIENTATION=-
MSGKEIPFREGDWNCALCENHNFRAREFCNRCAEPKKLSDESLQLAGREVRPGDWICVICDNRNFASRACCHKCQAQKEVSDLKLRAPPSKVQGGGGGGGGGGYSGGGSYGGSAPNMLAAMMGGGAPSSPSLGGLAYGAGAGYGAAPQQGNPMQAALLQNFMQQYAAQQQAQQVQQAQRFSGGYGAPVAAGNGNPGDWICPGCDNNNYAFRSQCFRCQIPKPECNIMPEMFSGGGGGDRG